MLTYSLLRRLLPVALVLLSGCSSHARPETGSAPLSKGKSVRIMALGDSITRGSGSGYGNYRRPLQALLTQSGYSAEFVGTNTKQSFNYHGSDPEQNFTPYGPNHEGYGGFRIDQIASDSAAKDDGGVSYGGLTAVLGAGKPDVILMMLGTNDVNQGYDPGGPGYKGGTGFAADAAQRLDALVSRLYEKLPDLTLVLATITPLGDPAKNAQVQTYNAFIPQIIAAHKAKGENVLEADMSATLTPADLSSDGVHPGTQGYDKMARVWYKALTGQMPPPLPKAKTTTLGAGRLGERNVFSPTDTVTASSTFAGNPFQPASLVDSTNRAFAFGDITSERVSISGFRSAIRRLRFFDAPSYTERTPGQVTIFYAPTAKTSLKPEDYVKLGTFPLPVVGDAYETRTLPAAHPVAKEPFSHPEAVIGFTDLDGLKIPPGTQSLLLDFSKIGGYGDALTEIQAFAPPAQK